MIVCESGVCVCAWMCVYVVWEGRVHPTEYVCGEDVCVGWRCEMAMICDVCGVCACMCIRAGGCGAGHGA
jgi:hypothetical protein